MEFTYIDIEKITAEEAHGMSQPFLKAKEKKAFGITGYKCISVYGWFAEYQTDSAILFKGINETGSYYNREQNESELWIPKSQIKIFEYIDDELVFDGYSKKEARSYLFFVKTWLYNQEKSTIQLNKFENHAF